MIQDNLTRQVARRVRDRRERLGLTLRALATTSGISSSMISDVERGLKSPTISTLSALAQALDVPISALLEDTKSPARRIRVTRVSERMEVMDPENGAKYDVYRPVTIGSRIELTRFVVPPGAVVGPFPAHAEGMIEHMRVDSGRIRVEFGAEEVELETGDCCTCLADAPHSFDNRNNSTEALIYIVTERA